MGRTTATVLFTDLVGSTELRGRVGEEAAEELRRTHDRLLTEAVEKHEGRVVKGLGDGIMATFAGASDAVAAAVAIQQAVDRLNRFAKTPVRLAVRVGLSAGDVSFEDDDVHGTPVVEASRLCGAADGGEILAAEVVRILAGSTGGHVYVSVGPLELKGLDHLVPAVRIGWEPAVVSSIPMPALLTDVGRVFVGRDDELQRLRQLWKEAAAGERRVAFLAGEPGVGKTRLAAELAAEVHSEGATVLAGRCDEDLGVPYQPFVEALRQFVDRTTAEVLHERLGRYGGELIRLVPELSERIPGLSAPLRSDPETERYRLFDAVAAWVAATATDEPLLIVIDDLHWAAKPTLLLLRHVARSPEPKRVLVVGTYRDTELAHDHPLAEVLADLRRGDGVERVSLQGLDPSGVAAYIERAAGHTVDGGDVGLARAVYEETEGNPFFVREVVRHLIETGAIQRQGDRWTSRLPVEQLGIPESVRDVVGRRLSRLSEDANRALRLAAVVGAECDLAVLQAAGRLDDEVLASALEEATQARLLIESGVGRAARYRFAHALVRDTLYGRLSAARRVALHRRVAESIEAVHEEGLDDHLPALAYHWARASAAVAEVAKAVDYAVRAGDQALGQLAHDEAVSYYRQALDLLGASQAQDEPRHLRLLIALGDAQRRASDPASRATLLQAVTLAQSLGDVDALARAALANTRGAYWSTAGAVDFERVAALEAALAADADTPTARRARLLATLGLELVFTADRSRRVGLSNEALRMARSLDDPVTLAHVLMTRTWTINAPDTLAERLANVAELLELAGSLDDPLLQFIAHFLRARVTLESGEFDDGSQHLRTAGALADELGQPMLHFVVSWVSVGHVARIGSLPDADRAARDAYDLGCSNGEPDAEFVYLLQRSSIRFEQGRLGELATELSDACQQLSGVPGLATVLAAAHGQSGRLADAHHCLEPLAATGFDLPQDPVRLGFLAFAVDVVCQLDHRSWAQELYELLRPYAGQFPVLGSVSRASTAHYLGMLAAATGRYPQAEDHFSAAEALHTRIAAPGWLASTRLERGRMLLTRRGPGDAEQARQLLSQAIGTARELGLSQVDRRAVDLLQECP